MVYCSSLFMVQMLAQHFPPLFLLWRWKQVLVMLISWLVCVQVELSSSCRDHSEAKSKVSPFIFHVYSSFIKLLQTSPLLVKISPYFQVFDDLWARGFSVASRITAGGPGQLRLSSSSVYAELCSVWCWSGGQVKRSLDGCRRLTLCHNSSLRLCRSGGKRPVSSSSALRGSTLHLSAKLFTHLTSQPAVCIFTALLTR